MASGRDTLIDTLEQAQEHHIWALQDLTEAQRYFVAGACNPISYTAFHMMYGLDRTCNHLLQGKETIWLAKAYWQKLGLQAEMRPAGLTQAEQSAVRVEPWGELVNFTKDVITSCLDYLHNTSEEDLETLVEGARVDSLHHNGAYSKIRTLRGRVTHVSAHMGEIFAIRGMQGLKGSPV